MSLNWVTISSLATAGGTLVLAVATFSSVRSANRTARAAERSLQIGLRPLLFQSRQEDPGQKIMFGDEHWVKIPGGAAIAEIGCGPDHLATGPGQPGSAPGEAEHETVYLALSLHNAGYGLAVIHGWRFYPSRVVGLQNHPPPEEFRMQSRDLYIPVNDTGFWQAAIRDPGDPEYAGALDAVRSRMPVTVDLLYGDHEGGQRVISRFSLVPRTDSPLWLPSVVRHWNIDRPDPRLNPTDAETPRDPQPRQ